MGLGLGSWLCRHSPLEPRSHHCRPAKRSGSSMITFSEQILPTRPYEERSISASSRGGMPPRRRVPVRQAASLPRSRRSSSAKSSRGSWWPTSVKTRLKDYDLTSRSILSLDSKRPNRTAVRCATLSCSGLTSQRTHNSSVLTG